MGMRERRQEVPLKDGLNAKSLVSTIPLKPPRRKPRSLIETLRLGDFYAP